MSDSRSSRKQPSAKRLLKHRASTGLSSTANDRSNEQHLERGVSLIVVCLLIGMVGLGVGATILAIDIPEQAQAQSNRFHKVADEAFLRFNGALDEYKVSGLWLHQACHDRRMPNSQFRDLYRHITWTGVEFLGLACGLNVTASERRYFENQSRKYLAKRFPEFQYRGFTGVTYNDTTGKTESVPMPNATSYFVAHFVEPLENPYNQRTVDFDMSTSSYHREVITQALVSGNFSVTGRLSYLPPPSDPAHPYEYSLMMAHPGLPANIDEATGTGPYGDAAILVVRFNALLEKAYNDFSISEETTLYVYDSTPSIIDKKGQPVYLGGARLGPSKLSIIAEANYSSLWSTPRQDKIVSFAGRQWSVVVIAPPTAYKPNYFLAIFGALMIVVASACAAMWIFARTRAKAEKTAILLDSAERAARAQRELNDFIAHEVRNPLSAAISANEFVSLAVNEIQPLMTPESKQLVCEDVLVIGNSLRYINDLLRSMLDFHCVLSNQISVQSKPVGIRHDIFDHVASMLYHRGCGFDVLVDCPEELVVMSDPLRLKQIVLNLAVNATKFVTKGYVRLRAELKDNIVHLYVEDSGPGIPLDRREQLFNKFQPSLDSLSQGTGIGLSLSKHLMELMDGDIRLDDTYRSSIDGCPGCRFIVNLKTRPVTLESSRFLEELNDEEEGIRILSAASAAMNKQDSGHLKASLLSVDTALPDTLSALFVDDDFILRKLFVRSIKRCRPNWAICEAASGEAALQLIQDRGPNNTFDVVFLDQYMASTQKQLLGTETVRLLRSKGVHSVICGLSANDIENQFVEAGADCFSMKPLPCDNDNLVVELKRILNSRERS
ncbi:hypothetical protein MPSEU_000188300 [Mayamaea pseudoterrestris]|nr:hypothetical protein MPSEU_000188300 [Mayamaea pseudoterrestris]